MATNESQLDGESVSTDRNINAEAGLRDTVETIKRDATARWGLYIVAFVLFVSAYTLVDSNLSRLTFGAISDFTIAEIIPIFDHPERLPPPGEAEEYPPVFIPGGSFEYLLGTDPSGRDYFTRIVYGSQVSVGVGLVSTFIGLVGGTIVGAVAGYYGGHVDDVLMRIVETVYAIPPLILVIVFTAIVTGGSTNITYAIIAIGITFIPVFARIIRSRVLTIREVEYIEAARAAGVKDRHIILRHIIPNSFAPVMVYATLQIGVTILIVAGLSFLGYGAQPPTPDWGMMLQTAHGNMHSNVWLSIWPGLAIVITIMGFNLFGDGLQDAFNPRIDD